jgi:hypothetical protein
MKRVRAHPPRILGMAAAAALIAMCSIPAVSANAASPAARPRPASHVVARLTAPMTIVRVARLVTKTPDRAGQVLVQLVNGAVIAIPAADKDLVMRRAAEDARTANPDNTVHGNCGSSWIYLYDKSDNHPLRFTTGFTVKLPAVGYKWNATVTAKDGFKLTYSRSGTLALRHSGTESRYRPARPRSARFWRCWPSAPRCARIRSSTHSGAGSPRAAQPQPCRHISAACALLAAEPGSRRVLVKLREGREVGPLWASLLWS